MDVVSHRATLALDGPDHLLARTDLVGHRGREVRGASLRPHRQHTAGHECPRNVAHRGSPVDGGVRSAHQEVGPVVDVEKHAIVGSDDDIAQEANRDRTEAHVRFTLTAQAPG